MSYIRHKILIDSALSQAYTREQPEDLQGRPGAIYRPEGANENRSHPDPSKAAFSCRQSTSLTGFWFVGRARSESNWLAAFSTVSWRP